MERKMADSESAEELIENALTADVSEMGEAAETEAAAPEGACELITFGEPADEPTSDEAAAPDEAAGASGASARKRKRWKVVLVVALAVLVAALAVLGAIWMSYLQGQQEYEELAEYVDVPEESGDEGFHVDWDALREVNPDVVAWVWIPGTNINYPVVQTEDNDYYLTHDFEGDEGWLAHYGAIFMDWQNDPYWSDQAYFIYGHHMRDGSMFADVAGMASQERFDASRTVYVLSPTRDFTLRTFALIHCADDDPLVQPHFASSEELAAYAQDKVDRSIVNVGDIASADRMRKLFAFATCDNGSGGRYVLYAYVERKGAM